MVDFEHIQLSIIERVKLAIMRLKKSVGSSYLGKSKDYFFECGLIRANHKKTRNIIGEFEQDGTYSLTDKYRRFIRYRRHIFLKGTVYSIVVSLVTTGLTLWLSKAIEGLMGSQLPQP